MSFADILRHTLNNLESGPRLSEKIRKGTQGSVVGPLNYNGERIAMKVFDYTDRPDVARAIKEFQREYENLKALSHPSIIRFIAFDHVPEANSAYLRMQWASTELSQGEPEGESKGAVDLGDIICHHDGLHSGRSKLFLPESFIWHVLFHLSAALSLCHHGIRIQRKKIVERTDTLPVLNRLTKSPPPDLCEIAMQHPRVAWATERITFSVDTSHTPIIHRDIKPRNVLLCDPPWNGEDETWRKSISIADDDMFCVYPVVLLGDFGLSVPLQVAETIVGSYGFTAPEIPLGSYRPDSLPFAWTTSCDIFSLGATIWNLMTLETPPSSLNGCSSLPGLPSIYSQELRELVLKCCVVDQYVRPTAVNILDNCIQRGSWNESLVSPYGTIISLDFQTALRLSWHDCLDQLSLLSGQSRVLENQTAIVDNSLSLMKLDQQEKYGKFAIFIAGAYLMKNTIHDVHFLVPMQRTPHFVGRQYELGILHSRINSTGDDQLLLALCGLGGIGKTQIAIQFAHQLMERDAGISVFWVNGSNVSAVEESYHRIAAKCKILSTGQLDSFLIFRVKEWLESERAGRFLMIFDNVEDYFMGKEYDIYIPKCSHGSILFTTRDQRFAKNFCLPSHIVKVPIITELDSVMLLKKFLPSSLNLGTSDDLALLSKKLGHHPLAITQAAAYLRSMRRPILEYLRYFENQQKAMRILKYKALDFTRDKGWESLYSTWEISFERVEEEDALGFDVLALMSFLDPDTIPMFLLAQEFTDILSLSEAISNLRSMSLISPYNEGETYAIHPLIQLFMQDRLESQGDRQRFLSMSLHLLARLFPENPDECSDTSSVLLPHATKILKLEAVSHEDLLARAELLHKVSQCELKRGRLRNAEELAREAFLINSKLLGRTARATANCQVHLARALVALGKYHEARESAAESFEAFQEIDPCGPDTLRSMDNLAEVLRHQGQYHEAQEMHEKAFTLKERLLGRSHPDTLVSLNNLALTYWIQGRFKEAETLTVEVMEARNMKLGVDHSDILISMNNLASIYMSQGRWKEAEQLELQVVETRRVKLGVDHPDTLASLHNLASTYLSQGRFKEAEHLLEQVLETRKLKLGVDHPDTLMSMSNLASMYMSQDRREEAEQLQLRVVETRRMKLSVDHPDTLMSMSNLASMYMSQDRWEEAEQLQLQVVENRRMKLGVDHRDTLMSMSNLASMYMSQNRWEEAERLELQVVETRRMKLGVDHPDTLMSMSNLASMYMSQDRREEAEQLQLQVVENRRMKLGVDHRDTLMSMSNLASTYMSQNRWEEAERLELQVVETRRMKLSVDHPDTLTSMANLAFIWKILGRYAEAINLLREALSGQEQILGSSHPFTLSNSEALLEWETEQLTISS